MEDCHKFFGNLKGVPTLTAGLTTMKRDIFHYVLKALLINGIILMKIWIGLILTLFLVMNLVVCWNTRISGPKVLCLPRIVLRPGYKSLGNEGGKTYSCS